MCVYTLCTHNLYVHEMHILRVYTFLVRTCRHFNAWHTANSMHFVDYNQQQLNSKKYNAQLPWLLWAFDVTYYCCFFDVEITD